MNQTVFSKAKHDADALFGRLLNHCVDGTYVRLELENSVRVERKACRCNSLERVCVRTFVTLHSGQTCFVLSSS